MRHVFPFALAALLVLVISGGLSGALRAETVDAAFAELAPAPTSAQIRLITDNHEAWYARWWVIANAKNTIDCTYFTVANDLVGESLIGALLEKARQGVKIRMMVDARGSASMQLSPFAKDYLPALLHYPNVEVRRYNAFGKELALVPAGIKAFIASDHAKMLIVDGQWVVAGGRNIMDHWFTSAQDDTESFHDVDFIAHGDGICEQAKAAFEDEYKALHTLPIKPHSPAAFEKASAHLEKVRSTMDGLINGQIVPNDMQHELTLFHSMTHYASFRPFADESTLPVMLLGKHSAASGHENPITEHLLKVINAATETIDVAHAYMVLTDKVKTALAAASARGVKIRYLTNSPESTHSWMTQARFVKEWKTYLRDVPSLRIFALAFHHKLHGKMIVVDRRVSILGSYNMDPMSENINAEDVIVVDSPRFAAQALSWMEEVQPEGIEYKIKIEADGTLTQVVGPSDHCKASVLALLKILGWFDFLRPLI